MFQHRRLHRRNHPKLITMKPTLTQKEQIKAHLLSGKTITPLEALRHYGCMSLAQRISELKVEGMEINSTPIKVGENKRVAKYQLAE